MTVVVRPLSLPLAHEGDVEIVERKGRGHPDSMCDAVAEAFGLALSRHYLDACGEVLHHNVDKVLLSGGQSHPALGGGEVTTPFELFLAGRATGRAGGAVVPLAAIAEDAARTWLARNLHALDVERHARVTTLVRPGAAALADLAAQRRLGLAPAANDTSLGVGWAPLSPLETAVLAIEQRLTDPATARNDPALGEDVKVMAVRHGRRVEITVACAMVGSHLPDAAAYGAAKRRVAEMVLKEARAHLDAETDVVVNAADDARAGSLYLTVTGTSAEAGDDGEAGRGNRANGLITPFRPMTLESLAGKNPINHVGKLYNLAAGLIAQAIVRDVPGVRAAECMLVGRIGQPIDVPGMTDVRVAPVEAGALDGVRPAVEEVVARHLAWLPSLWRDLLAGYVQFDRWPFAGPVRPMVRESADEVRRREALIRVIADEATAMASLTGRPSLGARVMATMGHVPRHVFVPRAEERQAYYDGPLPIGFGQTISQPTIVALMTDLIRPREDHVVLEVGTGCGYQAAVLAELVRQVYSIEVVEPLAEEARRRLARFGYVNVEVKPGDGALGWAEHAPFDAIIVTAAAPEVPPALIEQLKPGGRLVAPIGNGGSQDLILIEKSATGAIRGRTVLPVAFVPLTRPGANGGAYRTAVR